MARNGELRHVYNWIRKELNDGYSITIEEIENIESEEMIDWQLAEKYWISSLRYLGFNLTNESDGGESSSDPLILKKRNEKLTGKHRSEETKHKISESNKHPKTELHKQVIKKAMTTIFGKKIKQYTRKGKYIRSWDSITLASETLHLSKANISKCCNLNSKYSYVGDFVWRFENDNYVYDDSNLILQLDKNYSVIKEWENATELANSLFPDIKLKSARDAISACCHFRQHFYKNYVFMFKKDFKENKFVRYK